MSAALVTAAPAHARTLRVVGVIHGSSATFAVHVAPDRPRQAQLTRGRLRARVAVSELDASLARVSAARLRVPSRLRASRGPLLLVLRLAPETQLRDAGAAGGWRLSSDSPDASFTCRVDGGRWQRCAPAWRPGLGAGSHRLEARARDRHGLQDETPAQLTITSTASVPSPAPSSRGPGVEPVPAQPISSPDASPDPVPVVPTLSPPGSVFQAFGSSTSFVNARLPDNAALSIATVNGLAVNPAVAAELERQVSAYGVYLNTARYTAPLTVVSASQPLTPVSCTYGQTACPWTMRQMMLGISPQSADLHGGLPIPDDYVPADASDTDAEAVFYQPEYVGPAGQRGRLYEAWKLRRNAAFDPAKPVSPSNPRWTAAAGGRVVGTATSRGHYVSWTASGYQFRQPGHPDSTYQENYWGVLASGLFIASDEVRREDCAAGRIDHVVGVLVHNAKPGHVWPAQRDDGSQPSSSILEGMRLRFPPGMAKPAFSNRFASMLFDAAQRYGLVVDDKTFSSVGIRVEPAGNGHSAPECWSLLDGAHGYDALAAFPWSRLQVVATGSDVVPTPTT